jgi:hypothetical protein
MAVLLATCWWSDAGALPPGRYWLPVDTTRVPGHTRLFVTGVSLDSLGRPMLYAAAEGGIGNDYTALSWADSAWVQRWSLGHSLPYMFMADGPAGRHPLVWQAYGLDELLARPGAGARASQAARPLLSDDYLVMSEDLGTTWAPPDTIAPVSPYSWIFAAATSRERRWAVKVDSDIGLRLFSSAAPRNWVERRIGTARGVNAVAIQTVNDTTAVVVWPEHQLYRLRWGLMAGDVWEEVAEAPTTGMRPSGVSMRRAGPGEYWVQWTDDDSFARLARLNPIQRSWSAPDTLRCAYRRSDVAWRSIATRFSPDTLPYPAVAWQAVSYPGSSYTLCVCVPSDSGVYPVAENLPFTDGVAQARIVRDVNEDVWVAWWTVDLQGMFWTHSVVGATASGLRVEKWGKRQTLRWTLSETAPGSWWTVLREERSGGMAAVARVRAGAGTEMSWVDDRPALGPTHYQLRRDCVDRRYEWLSSRVRWAGRGWRIIGPRWLPGDGGGQIAFGFDGAAGPLVLELYDVQGRMVARQGSSAWRAEPQALRLGLPARLASGVYFLRAADLAGTDAAVAKVVVLQ